MTSTTTPVHSDRTAATTRRLLTEFRWQVGEAEVARVVDGCVRDLSGVPAGAMPELVERSARQRLARRLGEDRPGRRGADR